MCRRGWIAALGSLLVLSALAVRAEVRAITDRSGVYKAIRVTKSGRGGVWAPTRRVDTGASLNPHGDRQRDLWPAVRESSLSPHHPWVVWSRLNGSDYDLVWSRWSAGRWESVQWLDGSSSSPGADLDPNLQFDRTGRPFVVWWRDRGAKGGSVYLSMFVGPTWLRPFEISAPSVDARYPVLEIEKDHTLVVRFVTDEGLVEQTVLFDDPDTITDDINPMDYVYLAGAAVLVERYPPAH
jgi:hypothetical protein